MYNETFESLPYCHPELVSGSRNLLMIIDPETSSG